MSRYHRKVIWSEGMFLTPHHFQQADHYAEDLLNFRLKSLIPFDWGLTELEIDAGALANGVFHLRRCRGLLPDGLAVDIPETDVGPDSRPIDEHFKPTAKTLGVFLAIPINRLDAPNCRLDGDGRGHPGGRETRYLAATPVSVPDENTGEGEREILCARKNLKILFSDESLDDYSWIKIAELARSSTGVLTLHEEYIPPCISIAASDRLMSITRALLEILTAKGHELAGGRRQKAQGIADFASSDAARFWLLHTVNTFVPLLVHVYNVGRGHPERLYLILSQLAGALTTFTMEVRPEEIPKYIHTDLTHTFAELDLMLRRLLEIVIPTRCIRIPLERTKESIYVGQIADERLLESAQFYLAVNAQVPEKQIIEGIPLKTKISSKDRIEFLIEQGLRGVEVNYSPVPPAPLGSIGFKYFQLDRAGRYWDLIRRARNISIYVPSEFTELKLELYAIKEG